MSILPEIFLKVISRLHENLENFEKESTLVPDHVCLLFGTGSHSAQCDR